MTNCLRTSFIIVLILGALAPVASQCFVDSIAIVPGVVASEREVIMTVQGLSPSDLSSDQALCRVFMEFDHGRISNVRMRLKSPAGQEITLIGPGTTGGSVSPLIKWDIQLVPCAAATLPDFGFDAVWDNDQNWASLNTYTGIYHPHSGCLEDFNMGSAEGAWTLTIENLGNNRGSLSYFALTFCSGSPDDCTTCSAYPGEYSVQTVEFCEGVGVSAPLAMTVPAELSAADTLLFFLVDDGGVGSFVGELGDLSYLPAGSNSLCPVTLPLDEVDSITGTVTDLVGLQALADDTDSCITLGDCIAAEVFPFQLTVRDDFLICAGDTLVYGGQRYTESLDTFLYEGSPSLPCTERINLVVTVEEIELELETSSLALVCGQTALLDAGGSTVNTGPITQYDWTTSDGNYLLDVGPIAQVDQAGTYVVELGTDDCTVKDSLILTSVDTFFIILEQAAVLCPGDEMVIAVQDSIPPNGAPTAFEITTVTGPDLEPIIVGSSITVTEPGLYEVTISAGSCMVTNQILVTAGVVQPFTVAFDLADAQADTLTCDVTSVPLTWTTDIPDPQAEFSGPELIPSGTLNPEVGTPGTYYLEIRDNNDCSYMDSVEVVLDDAAPMVTLDDVTFNCDSPLDGRLLFPEVVGEVSSYIWSGPDLFSSEEEMPIFSVTGNYELTVTAPNGCTDSATLIASIQNQALEVLVDSLVIPCGVDSVLICATVVSQTELVSMGWDGMAAPDSCFHLKEEGTYRYFYRTEGGCSDMITYVATREQASDVLQLTTSNMALACDGGPVVLRATGFGSAVSGVTWILEGAVLPQFQDDTMISVMEPGRYEVVVELAGSTCLLSETITITGGVSDLQVNVGPDLNLKAGESVQLDAQLDRPFGNQVLDWMPADILSCTDCLDPVLTATSDTELILTVTDSLGCTASDTLRITLTEDQTPFGDSLIYFPTIFQPGLTGTGNDRYQIGVNPDEVQAVEFLIYDRWGNLMVDYKAEVSSNLLMIWDGSRDGQAVEAGVYVYMAKYLQLNGMDKVVAGTITLIR